MPKPGKRRKFSAAEKLRIVREAAAHAQRWDIEALLRREGIYSSLLAAWRKQLALHGSEALADGEPGRKPKQDAKDRLSSAFKMEGRSLGDIGPHVHFENVDSMRRDKCAIMCNDDFPLEWL
ncbi:hypothetical protein BE08_31220 [Sorangium cellulosum]|uniref:Transposase n=1 Tax=Sorangium cellulosum TaxID=56 RepID=A0A150PP72_SORCE|nr:hypothetical protein BE08_31220 [Sorangium cellulosum]